MPPISRQVSAGAAGEGEGEGEVEAGRNFGSGLFVCGEAGPVWVRPRRRRLWKNRQGAVISLAAFLSISKTHVVRFIPK